MCDERRGLHRRPIRDGSGTPVVRAPRPLPLRQVVVVEDPERRALEVVVLPLLQGPQEAGEAEKAEPERDGEEIEDCLLYTSPSPRDRG